MQSGPINSHKQIDKTKKKLNLLDDSKHIGTNDEKEKENESKDKRSTEPDDEDSDDETNNQIFSAENSTKPRNKFANAKYHTRIAAVKFIQRIILKCSMSPESNPHFDLKKAREIKDHDYLVLHLQELIRVACMTATSNFDELTISGLDLLQDIIRFFRQTKDPEFDAQLLLEQYQAQIDAALKLQFSYDTSAYVVSKACQVCSSWINSGVARTVNDLHRVNFLLVSSLQKLNSSRSADTASKASTNQPNSFLKFQFSKIENQFVYSELSVTIEKISVISAWAEVSTYSTMLFFSNSNFYLGQQDYLLLFILPQQ